MTGIFTSNGNSRFAVFASVDVLALRAVSETMMRTSRRFKKIQDDCLYYFLECAGAISRKSKKPLRHSSILNICPRKKIGATLAPNYFFLPLILFFAPGGRPGSIGLTPGACFASRKMGPKSRQRRSLKARMKMRL